MSEVRFYIINPDGELEALSTMPFDHYGGCPNVGDTVCYSWFRDQEKVFSVQRRYFVENNDSKSGWAVILKEVAPSVQTEAVRRAWYDDDDFSDALDAEEERKRESELQRVYERLALLLGRPPPEIDLDLREENTMKMLAKRGVGAHLTCRAIPDFGPRTRDKLAERGFITTSEARSGKFKDDQVTLTPEGTKALKDLKAYRKKVEAARNSP